MEARACPFDCSVRRDNENVHCTTELQVYPVTASAHAERSRLHLERAGVHCGLTASLDNMPSPVDLFALPLPPASFRSLFRPCLPLLEVTTAASLASTAALSLTLTWQPQCRTPQLLPCMHSRTHAPQLLQHTPHHRPPSSSQNMHTHKHAQTHVTP